MKKLVLSLVTILVSSNVMASNLTVKTIEITDQDQAFEADTDPRIAAAGEIIAVAEKIVALGESVYKLVQHGKPNNSSTYAPISVIPKDPITKEPVNILDLEDCSMPKTKKFRSVVTALSIEVVRFDYQVTFTHSCSYNGRGKYISAAELKPISVSTGYGWDVNATMKLSGLANHGKKIDPNVGASLTISYSMASWSKSFADERTIHITGDGQVVPQ